MKEAGRIISVGGGKGGVGKSLVSANLAVAFAQCGRRVVLVDADLGAPNLHTLLGVDRLPRTLDSLFNQEICSLAEARLPTLVPNLELIAGSPAHPGAANLAHTQKLKLLRHVSALDADVVVVDVGAGTSFNALDVFNVADLRLVVTTPQLTSVQNAYAFLKGAVHRLLRQLAQGPEQLELLGDGQGQDTARMRGLLTRVRAESPGFARAISALLDSMGVSLLGNQVVEAHESSVAHSVSRMISDFLSVEAPVIGSLRASRKVHESVNNRRPWLLDPIRDPSMLALHAAAKVLLDVDVKALRRARAEAEVLAELAAAPPRAEPLPVDLSPTQRRHARVPVELNVKLSNGTLSCEGQVTELSRSGALVSTAEPLERGSRWTISFSTLEGAPHLEVLVRSVRSGKALGGVEFASTESFPRVLDEALRRAEDASAHP